MKTTFHPVIIIGAGRSGTNMLRNVLTAFPGVGTWPCDEINYIWRHGNARYPTDEFPADLATPRVCRYIRRQFARLAARQRLSHVVEKTCANSLRVSFVRRVFPEAYFVCIVRDGRDVAASAAERWTAPLEIPYLLKKARFVPPGDLPYYGARYFCNRLHRFVSRETRLASWGPRFRGISELLAQHPLPVVCAIQWKRSVEAAEQDLAGIDPAHVFHVRYEDFVSEPARHLERLLKLLDIPAAETDIQSAVRGVSRRSVGRSKAAFDDRTHAAITEHIGHALERFSYDQ